MSGISVSIVIPSYNSHKTISRTIESLVKSDDYVLINEIIIVDSSDDNATKGLLGSFADTKLRLIHSGIKVMPSLQRNIGAEQATGDLLVFIDSDAYTQISGCHGSLQPIIQGGKPAEAVI
jgi:glycosyltransferase involved in cell wall biosynthesis